MEWRELTVILNMMYYTDFGYAFLFCMGVLEWCISEVI